MNGKNPESMPPLHARIVATTDVQLREKRVLELAKAAVCGGEGATCGVCRHCTLAQNGVHPDIIFIDRPLDDKGKRKREIPVALVRHMAADVWVLPQEAEKKVYVIREADKMNVQAQNAALKVLEEPPAYAVFILGAGSPEALLPTVVSRCGVQLLGDESVYEDDPLAKEYLELARSGGAAALCGFFAENERLDSERVLKMLDNVRRGLSRFLGGSDDGLTLTRRDAAHILELVRRAEGYLRLNVSVKHVLGMLCVLTISGEKSVAGRK